MTGYKSNAVRIGVVIGRFQVPELHGGHQLLIRTAIEECDHVIVLVGSSNSAPTIKNPFTYKVRALNIKKEFPSASNKITCAPLNDYPHSDAQWISDVVQTVQHVLSNTESLELCAWHGADIVLYGHTKPDNEYLKWFGSWQYREVLSPFKISGTEIRESLFGTTTMLESVNEDYVAFQKEKAMFADYPFLDHLNVCCGDAVVECQGHVLLVRRARAPGRGTWALPGGHKKSNETFMDCVLRELGEETNLRVPKKVLLGSVVKTQMFDKPNRGCGLTRVTMAVHIKISPDPGGIFPRVSPADDADHTEWVLIGEALNKLPMYDDHSSIISTMTGTNPLIAVSNQSIYTR